MSACLTIAQYVSFHLSFDRYHEKSDRIVRIHSRAIKNGEDHGNRGYAAAMYGPTINDESKDVLNYGRFWELNYLNNTIKYKAENILQYEEPSVFAGDKSLFEIFDFEILAGSVDEFNAPQKAVLTESVATKYFKNFDQAIGETFELDGNSGAKEYELVAVVDDLPTNSHISFGVLISMKSIDNYTKSRTSWYANDFFSYLLLAPGSRNEDIEKDLNRLYVEHAKEVLMGYGYDVTYFLTPLNRIHLFYTGPDFVPGVDIKLILALGIIALIILIIAWINYLNLALVKTVERLKEVGIRKVMGSSTGQITSLFMMEAVFLNLISFLVALTITQLASPFLQSLTSLTFNFTENVNIILILFSIVIVGTVIIGYYPAIMLKTFDTSNILLGNKKNQRVGKVGLRSVLVSLQFIITFLLIAVTITVWKQVDFMKSSDLGLPINNIMVIKAPPGNINSTERADLVGYNSLKTELLKNSGIVKITNSGEVPGTTISWGTNIHLSEKTTEESVWVSLVSCGLEYLDFFELEAIAGRTLRKGDDPWTKKDVVINEKLAEVLGFQDPEDAIGANLSGFYAPLQVRGVIENHHHTSLHNDYEPTAFILSSWSEFYFIKFDIASGVSQKERYDQFQKLVKTVESEWDNSFPNNQLDYFFLDEFYDRQYASDDQFGRIFTTFSSLAILIACLGLFGLTSFTLQQRTKEIGIRKVLGAQMGNLIILLSKNYFITILIAYLVSMPIAWLLLSQWLENYTFRIELGVWLLIIPLLFVITVAIITIFSRLIKSIKINPVDSLRYE